ncbi:protease modulator HflC [Steroidobacter sp. S1-65]|uniref:Protein HflC n=1 Tax=Steroidobacter gossypii TaxID=2805490 RepID=A0ABS1X6A9_9GAMM|nr:protease modulator HflC [Steroidobacter gossypii]MBM0108764.1 protease modulator HflC [Steroidobacter gossypii]
MASRGFLVLILAAVVAFTLAMSTFTVRETELAIKFRFGEIVRADYAPGLHFMVPMVNNIRKFERRIVTKNYPSEQFLTSEGKILRIDFYIKWRISDVGTYYQATGGDIEVAAGRLGSIVKDGIKGTIARRTIQQVVAAERAEFTGEILKLAEDSTKGLGLQLVDVRVKKIDLPEEVSESVFSRMRQDFDRQAKRLRAEGEENAEKLRSEADRQRTEILAEAYRESEIIRGEGDAKSADIYARAYSRNAEFYSFHRSLQAYREAIGTDNDVLVISPDSEFFKYLNRANRR